MAGSVIIPRDVIEQLVNEPELLALMIVLVARARYTPGNAAKGTELRPGQLATGKRAIASQFKWTESKAYRALKRLQERNLIELTANREGTIVTLCNSERYRQFGKRKRTSSEPPADGSRTAIETKSNQDRTPYKKGIKKQAPPPSPSGEVPLEPSGWTAVGGELRALGISRVDDAVETARARRLSVEEVRSLIAEWRQHEGAWGVGALYQRLTGELAAWPEAAEKFRREQSRLASFDGHLANVAARKAGEKRSADDHAWLDQLKGKHRAKIEAMSNEDIERRLAGNKPLLAMFRSKGICHLVLDELYAALEEELEEAVA